MTHRKNSRKAHGKDLRKIGSGNIGATNLARAVGKKWGILCFLLDVGKGFLPTFISSMIISSSNLTNELIYTLIVGFAAVIGHIFTIFAKFRGGKGVATSFGLTLGVWPYYTICALIAFTAWIAVIYIWRYISLASIIASIAFPIVLTLEIIVVKDWQFGQLWPLFIAATLIPVIVIIRHRENIKNSKATVRIRIIIWDFSLNS